MTPSLASALTAFSIGSRDGATSPIVYVLIGICYVYLCFRVAMHARKRGRSLVKWFFITLFFTAVPAAVMFIRDWNRRHREPEEPQVADEPPPPADRREPLSTCPHCNRLIGPAGLDTSGGAPACPHCGMFIDEAHRA